MDTYKKQTQEYSVMKPPFFTYISPKTLDEVVSLLDQDSQDSRILAGGQSLMTMLNMRLIRPRILIDIKNLDMKRIWIL